MSHSIEPDDEAAALWVAAHMGGAVDAAAFAAWLAGDPGRQRKFDALWATCMDGAVTDGLRRHHRLERAKRSDRRHLPRGLALGALAAAAAVVGLAFAWPGARLALTPGATYETAAGQIRDVTLADGSTVALNGASRIRVKIGGGRRQVALERGEALFDVKHDPARPFVVVAGDGRVTVLGTRFDLALNRARVDLEVERGLVRFESGSGASSGVLVPASHRSVLADGMIAPPTGMDAGTAAAWETGWLRAADMPLAEILPRLERWSDKPIIVNDQALLGKRVEGRFRLPATKVALESLGALHGFRVRDTGRAYVIDAR